MSSQNYGSYQKPGQTKAYLELWAERLRLPDTITEHDKQEVVRYAQDLQEKHMTDTIKVNLTPVEQRMEEINHALHSPLPGDPREFDPFFDTSETHFDTHGNLIDSNGEVIGTGRSLEAIGEEDDIIIESNNPEYIVRLQMLDIPDEDKAALLSIYDSPIRTRSFAECVKEKIMIYGGIIWWHPPFKPNSRDEKGNPIDMPTQAGYKQIKLLSLDETGNPYIITASFGSLATHVDALLRLRGWFLWKEPIEYELGQHPKTKAFQMVNTSRVKTMLAGMAPAKKTK